jgi:hypothetical protein
MVANSTGAGRSTAAPDLAASPNERKLRQLVLTLVAQLAEAQFSRADQPKVERLWQEVAALEIDPERIIRLLYGGHDVTDREALAAMDRAWTGGLGRERPRPARPWLRRPWPAAGRRSAPRAALPARH